MSENRKGLAHVVKKESTLSDGGQINVNEVMRHQCFEGKPKVHSEFFCHSPSYKAHAHP